ncbi:PREDICTED: serine/threonine-protein kinase VRK1-like isoform X2 [Ceratosolen solmsi marchali]|nr:PREDICTED: serine/threonine-protein kinase VRK1-like isoform X2 [Ceratosolen solmsi marchali]
MHFYMRNANPNDISTWKKEKKLQYLGMPPFLGSGSHEYNNEKYRFIVMERYGTDIWTLFLENGRKFSEHTVYKVAWQIINVLEYIHSRTYVHADIKGANLLLDLKTQNHVFLVDFGLASHFTTKEEYKLDPKKAHNGTIEYTSRDAHMGVPTMRGDFEILLYNMIQWLSSSLPWEKNLKDLSLVQQQKEKAFNNVQKFLNECFISEPPVPICQFMSLIASMKFNEIPNYNKFRDIIVKGLQKLNYTLNSKLEFSIKKTDKPSSMQRKSKVNIGENKNVNRKLKSVSSIKNAKETINSTQINSLDNSIDSIILDEKCISGKDIKKQLLANIDGDAEYEVQIKKRKARINQRNGETIIKPTAKRSRKKLTKREDISITDSEPEVIPITKGTRSRPGFRTLKNHKKNETHKQILNGSEYDSEKDIFEESYDD